MHLFQLIKVNINHSGRYLWTQIKWHLICLYLCIYDLCTFIHAHTNSQMRRIYYYGPYIGEISRMLLGGHPCYHQKLMRAVTNLIGSAFPGVFHHIKNTPYQEPIPIKPGVLCTSQRAAPLWVFPLIYSLANARCSSSIYLVYRTVNINEMGFLLSSLSKCYLAR